MRRRTFIASAAAAAATPLLGSCGRRGELETPPKELVSFGSKFQLQDGAGAGQTVTLKAIPGPLIDSRSGAFAVADPWSREELPERELIRLRPGKQPSLLSTIEVQRQGNAARTTLACAAAIGPLDEVVEWRPVAQKGKPFWLYPDSALGAFYDFADEPALRPLFGDEQHMFGVYKRALKDYIVPMRVEGRVAAVVFLAPDGAAAYPVYAGFGGGGHAVALLVDLKILNPRRPWNKLNPAKMTGPA